MSGILYLVATPIGNLADISLRAIETLKAVDVIACEDTRHTGKLLKHYDISKKLESFHEHNENDQSERLLDLIKTGKSIALVTDAGTPGISDPGFTIVKKAHSSGITVVSIPGAVAFVNAAVVSGLPTDSLFFGGFLPSKKGDRRKRLEEVKDISATLIFYETPHRIKKTLDDCIDILGNRESAIVRELTKLHEEILKGDLVKLAEHFAANKPKGEIVLVIDRKSADTENDSKLESKKISDRVNQLQNEGYDHKKALKIAAKDFGISRSEAYRTLQMEKDS